MSGQDSAAEKRARWHAYFEQQLTGTDAEVDAATDAAMRALERGADADAIVAAGREGARVFRTRGAVPATAAQATISSPMSGTARPPVATPAPVARGRRVATDSSNVVGSSSSGIVNGLQQRQEMYGRTYFTVWNFRLERTDASGAAITPIPVEMRGRRFNGAINNGDLVELGKSPRGGKLVRTRKVRNATIGADVTSVGRRHPVLRVFGVLLVLAFMAVWIVIVLAFGGAIH